MNIQKILIILLKLIKNFIGKFKDEAKNEIITEFLDMRPKNYC